MTGYVTSMPSGKFFGFIKAGDREYFFHRADYSGYWDDLRLLFDSRTKVEVEFEPVDSAKGPRAANVRRVDE